MRSKILLFSFILFVLSSNAQDNSFQLKDFKYRTPGFRALSVGINFSGNISDANVMTQNEGNSKSLVLAPSLLSYYRIISTDKRLHSSTVSLQPGLQLQKTKQYGMEFKNNNFQYSFLWERNDKLYRNNDWFFEIGNRLTHSLLTATQQQQSLDARQKNIELKDIVVLGFGKGRIEQVQDAQMALNIIRDLEQQGLVSNLSAESIIDFASLITDINSNRVFDTRRKRMYELSRIDSFLRNSGWAPTTDIRHFNIINDNWVLANNPGRLSGTSWFAQLQPGVEFLKEFSEATSSMDVLSDDNIRKSFSVSPVVGFEKYVPVNLQWQQNLKLSLAWVAAWTHDENTHGYNGSDEVLEQSVHETQTRLSGKYGLGYYPNTRTLIDASVNLEAIYTNYDKDYDLKNSFLLIPSFVFSTSYFISYKTRLSAYLDINYAKYYVHPLISENYQGRNFSTSVSISLTHNIF